MATTIFFNGRLIATPGAYSEIDASGLETTGLGASGIVAVLGTGEGGRPVTDITEIKDLIRFTSPSKARQTFRSGDLREACAILFEPSRDPAILAGAQEVIAMKTNSASKATATFAGASNDVMTVSSVDYGAYTNQTNIEIASGTTAGKLINIRFEDVLESGDDIGGTNIYTLAYAPGTNGYATMVSSVSAAGVVTATGTKTAPGATALITTQPVAGSRVEVISDNAADNTQSVTVYGLNNAGTPAPQTETITLTGTSAHTGTATWTAIYGVEISAAHAGVVSVRDADTGGNPVSFDVPSGTLLEGVTVCSACFVAGTTVSAVSSGATTGKLLLFGTSTTGGAISESKAMTGTSPITSTTSNWGSITRIVTGNCTTGQTITLTAVAVASTAAVQTTVQKLKDLFNSKKSGSDGFTLDLITGNTGFPVTKLDTVTSTNILSTTAGFKADLYAVIDWINDNSAYATAEKVTNGIGAPSNTTSPVFLAGGSEGSSSGANYLTALNLLKQVQVNSIVVLSGDPSVHADVIAHCDFMCGIGRKERDAFVGLMNGDLDDVPSKSEAKSQIVDLNSRHVRATAQAIERFSTAGVRTEYLPPFTACLAAGMQAGGPVGQPLTFKYANALSFRQDTSWNPIDDSEEMIQAGLLFLENVEGVGRRWVRNVTTYLKSDNIAFIEGSVNQAVNFATFTLRTALEFAVGRAGFAGTVNDIKAEALNVLGLLVDAKIIVAHRALSVELNVDVADVAVEIAPVLPINFVPTTVHLVTVQQRAA